MCNKRETLTVANRKIDYEIEKYINEKNLTVANCEIDLLFSFYSFSPSIISQQSFFSTLLAHGL